MGLIYAPEGVKRSKRRWDNRMLVLFFLVMTVVVILFFQADGQNALTYWVILPLSSLIFTGLIALTVNPNLPFGRWLNCQPLSWIGAHSYEIYLCQYPIIFFVQRSKAGQSQMISFIIEMALILCFSTWLHKGTSRFRKKRKVRLKFRKQNRKIQNKVCILMTGIFVIGGVYSISTAPAERMTADQRHLQSELKENTLLLNRQDLTTPPPAEAIPAVKPKATLSPDWNSQINSVTEIGDSVMLGAAPELQASIPDCIVDAEKSLQIWDAIETVRELETQEKLGDVVIIGLGSNGSFDKSTGQELLNVIGSRRTIYWITVYGKYLEWQDSTNQMIERLSEVNDNLTIIDWAETASEHSEWFYDDGMHLNEDGQAKYANFIARNLSGGLKVNDE